MTRDDELLTAIHRVLSATRALPRFTNRSDAFPFAEFEESVTELRVLLRERSKGAVNTA